MFGFFKKSQGEVDVIERMRGIAKNANGLVHNTLSKSDPLIEVEVFIYLYTITDYWFMMKDESKEKRMDLNNKVFNLLKTNVEWNIYSRVEEKELEKLFDTRVMSYFKILEQSNKRMDIDYFKACVDYQVQLISNILINNKFSYYNPVPQSPREYSPLIMDFMMTSQVKMLLMQILDDVLMYIKIIK